MDGAWWNTDIASTNNEVLIKCPRCEKIVFTHKHVVKEHDYQKINSICKYCGREFWTKARLEKVEAVRRDPCLLFHDGQLITDSENYEYKLYGTTNFGGPDIYALARDADALCKEKTIFKISVAETDDEPVINIEFTDGSGLTVSPGNGTQEFGLVFSDTLINQEEE